MVGVLLFGGINSVCVCALSVIVLAFLRYNRIFKAKKGQRQNSVTGNFDGQQKRATPPSVDRRKVVDWCFCVCE